MQLTVKNREGEVVDTIEVADVLFGAPAKPSLVHQALMRQQANGRSGTASTKTRGQVSGGGRKPWRQKGTGRARQGSIRSPQWVGGGVVFGPHPRDYHQRMPKKMRRLAIRSALSSRVASEELILVDSLALEEPKTKEMRRILTNLGATRSTLVVTGESDINISKSAHNLPKVKALPAYQMNVQDILRYYRLVMTVNAVRRAEELWARPLSKKEVAGPPPAVQESSSEEKES